MPQVSAAVLGTSLSGSALGTHETCRASGMPRTKPCIGVDAPSAPGQSSRHRAPGHGEENMQPRPPSTNVAKNFMWRAGTLSYGGNARDVAIADRVSPQAGARIPSQDSENPGVRPRMAVCCGRSVSDDEGRCAY